MCFYYSGHPFLRRVVSCDHAIGVCFFKSVFVRFHVSPDCWVLILSGNPPFSCRFRRQVMAGRLLILFACVDVRSCVMFLIVIYWLCMVSAQFG